jgi:tetratricopeptide (TPR) repeat protein
LTLLRQDRREAALVPLELAHLLAPDDWQVRAWLGIALGESGELRRAHELLLPAALERPEALPIVSNAVALAVALGDHGSAVETLRARLAAEPDAGARPFRLQLAWLLATSRDDTLRDGEEALRTLEPLDDAADVLDVRAAAFAERGHYEEAVTTAERAIARTVSPTAAMRQHHAAYVAGRPWRE